MRTVSFLADNILGDFGGLIILTLLVGGLLVIASFIAYIVRWILLVKYVKYNKIENTEGYSGAEAARHFLDACDMKDVEVKKCGFWRYLVFGNSYSRRKKTVFLRGGSGLFTRAGNTYDSKTITAVALALQKVALAIQDRDGDKKFKFVNFMRVATVFAPVLFIPFVILGVLIDAYVMLTTGASMGFTFTLAFTILELLYYIVALVFTFLIVKVEKKANIKALELMDKVQFMTVDEREMVKSLFHIYIVKYVLDFIVALLSVIYKTLKLILSIVVKSSSNR